MKSVISVVIPTKNRPRQLISAISSVNNQTLSLVEIIVVDDGSSPAVLQTLSSENFEKIKIIRHEKSLGASAARNTGIRHAVGEFIAFLDDDDIWAAKKLDLQLKLFAKSPETLGLVYCGSRLILNDEVIEEFPCEFKGEEYSPMLNANLVGGTSLVMVRRTCFEHVGLFDETLRACQDWDMWLRISQSFAVDFVPDILVDRVVHGSQISSNIENRIQGRVQFLDKHRSLLEQDKKVYAQHLRRIGCLQFVAGHMEIVMEYFLKALRVRPLSRNTWICLVVFCLFPRSFREKTLTRFAVSRYRGIDFYH